MRKAMAVLLVLVGMASLLGAGLLLGRTTAPVVVVEMVTECETEDMVIVEGGVCVHVDELSGVGSEDKGEDEGGGTWGMGRVGGLAEGEQLEA